MSVNGRFSLNVPVTRVENARIVVNVDKSDDRKMAYVSVVYVVTEQFMGSAMDSMNLGKMRFTDLEPMKRRSDKRLDLLLAECRKQIDAHSGPVWSIVQRIAFENGVDVAPPETPMQEAS